MDQRQRKSLKPSAEKKRNAQNSLIEPDQNTLEVKRRRVEMQESGESVNETSRVGGVADVVRQHH